MLTFASWNWWAVYIRILGLVGGLHSRSGIGGWFTFASWDLWAYIRVLGLVGGLHSRPVTGLSFIVCVLELVDILLSRMELTESKQRF